MHPGLQITLAILATFAAIASAIAAWRSQVSSRQALDFQKRLAKHQDSLFLLRSTIDRLLQMKRILADPLLASDDEFGELESIHRQIRTNLQSLTQSKVISSRDSPLFKAESFGEIVDHMNIANEEIDGEVNHLQSKIDEIFS